MNARFDITRLLHRSLIVGSWRRCSLVELDFFIYINKPDLYVYILPLSLYGSMGSLFFRRDPDARVTIEILDVEWVTKTTTTKEF